MTDRPKFRDLIPTPPPEWDEHALKIAKETEWRREKSQDAQYISITQLAVLAGIRFGVAWSNRVRDLEWHAIQERIQSLEAQIRARAADGVPVNRYCGAEMCLPNDPEHDPSCPKAAKTKPVKRRKT